MPTMLEQRETLITEAREIVQRVKSAGRDLSTDEVKLINAKMDTINALTVKIDAAKEGEAIVARLGRLDGNEHPDASDSGGLHYLDLSPSGRKSMAAHVARTMVGNVDGAKALLPAGEVITAIPTTPADPIAQGQVATTLLSVLPSQVLTTPTARFFRQNTRINNAAAVAKGDVKPVSAYGLGPADVELRVYAHLSEPVDRFMVEDSQSLARFLTSELTYGVLKAVEADVINGASGGAGITGLLQTSGVRVTAFATDILTSIRSAITDAQVLGYDTDLVLGLSAADWAAAETAKASTSGVYLMTGPPSQGGPQSLFGVPVVVVAGLPAKTAVLINRPSVLLYVDRGIKIDWFSPGDTWSRNEIQARCEMRADLGVLQPGAIAKIGTAA